MVQAQITSVFFFSGPFKYNRVPLRRINQIYVIATNTKIDISGVKIPERVNDKYFKREKVIKQKRGEGDIFETEKKVRFSLGWVKVRRWQRSEKPQENVLRNMKNCCLYYKASASSSS